MIQKGLSYLSEKFINVRNRLHSPPDPTKRRQENTESGPLNNKDFHEHYIHESFHPRRRLSPDFSKYELVQFKRCFIILCEYWCINNIATTVATRKLYSKP